MTDKEKLSSVLLEIGLRGQKIKPSETQDDFVDFIETDDMIKLGCGDGYAGCCAIFQFDQDGNLKSYGCWE